MALFSQDSAKQAIRRTDRRASTKSARFESRHVFGFTLFPPGITTPTKLSKSRAAGKSR
jgi:hypothetical protein